VSENSYSGFVHSWEISGASYNGLIKVKVDMCLTDRGEAQRFIDYVMSTTRMPVDQANARYI
jgi:hypothetical protein